MKTISKDRQPMITSDEDGSGAKAPPPLITEPLNIPNPYFQP